MVAYRLAVFSFPVVVRLDVEGPDDYGPIQFEGQPDAVSSIRQVVFGAPAIAAYSLGAETTPADLDFAMGSPALRKYRPELLEGQAILDRYVRQVPGPGEAD